MEEARYWMWAKSKPEVIPRVLAPSSYGDSWEEQAFAEDAAGALGGCVWPPRSYSCSFCRRDFRSAQALGGHMNVHRRDRARLKQSPNTSAAEVVPQNHAFDPPYSSQMCSFLFSSPNPEFADVGAFATPVSGVIRVSSPPPAAAAPGKVGSCDEKVSSSLLFCSPNYVSPSWSSFLSEKKDEKKSAAASDPSPRVEKEDCVTDELSMGLNLVIRKRDTCNDEEEEEVGSCKRRKIEAKPLSFLSVVERCLLQPEVLKVGSVADDLDLELRLGDAPKVK